MHNPQNPAPATPCACAGCYARALAAANLPTGPYWPKPAPRPVPWQAYTLAVALAALALASLALGLAWGVTALYLPWLAL